MIRKSRKVRPVAKNCGFCAAKSTIDYKDGILSKYLSERGKILGRSKTGICSKHQRIITNAIKRARHVGLLPFVVRA
jgi:small subunit ribosomal protein S18